MKSISIKELESKVHEGVNVLDVREVHEFHNGHIPSAKNRITRPNMLSKSTVK